MFVINDGWDKVGFGWVVVVLRGTEHWIIKIQILHTCYLICVKKTLSIFIQINQRFARKSRNK